MINGSNVYRVCDIVGAYKRSFVIVSLLASIVVELEIKWRKCESSFDAKLLFPQGWAGKIPCGDESLQPNAKFLFRLMVNYAKIASWEAVVIDWTCLVKVRRKAQQSSQKEISILQFKLQNLETCRLFWLTESKFQAFIFEVPIKCNIKCHHVEHESCPGQRCLHCAQHSVKILQSKTPHRRNFTV